MATIPSLTLWAPGNIPTAAQFNSEIRDMITFLKAPPRVSAKNGSQITVPFSTTGSPSWLRLNWDNEDFDSDNIHGATNYRLIAVTAGYYFITVNIVWIDFGTLQNGAHGVQVRKNSNGSATGGGRVAYDVRAAQPNITGDIGEGYQSCNGYVEMAVNDYLEVFAAHGHDSAFGSDDAEVAMATTSSCRWSAIWIGKN